MGEIKVRVVPKQGAGAGQLTSGRALVENMLDRIDELGESITTIARRMGDRISADTETVDKPDGWHLADAQVTFSIDLEAEAGVIISKASAAAGFEVSMTWSRGR